MNPTTGVGTAVREFGGRFAEIDYKTSGGSDNYNALQTTLSRRFNTGLSLGMQHTWGHSIGNSAGSNEANTAGNPFDFNADHGSNNFDIRHSFNLNALYEVPVGKGRRYLQVRGSAYRRGARRMADWRHRQCADRRADRCADRAAGHRLPRHARRRDLCQSGGGPEAR